MQATARRVRADESLLAVEPQVAPLHEVFRLQGDDELEAAEHRYLPARELLSAVVLAAGEGAGFGRLTARRPRPCSRSRVDPSWPVSSTTSPHSVAATRSWSAATGPEAVDVPGARFVDNPDYASHGRGILALARGGRPRPGTLVAFGDIVLDATSFMRCSRRRAAASRSPSTAGSPAPPSPTASWPTTRTPGASASRRFSSARSATRCRPAEATASGSGSCIWTATAPGGWSRRLREARADGTLRDGAPERFALARARARTPGPRRLLPGRLGQRQRSADLVDASGL